MLEVSHNESYVWQRQGIRSNIIALKKVKCLCGGLHVWGGQSLCERRWLSWFQQEKPSSMEILTFLTPGRGAVGCGSFAFSKKSHDEVCSCCTNVTKKTSPAHCK